MRGDAVKGLSPRRVGEVGNSPYPASPISKRRGCYTQMRIVRIACALLQHGTLSGEQIFAEVPGLITAAEFNCWSGRAGRGR